MIAASNAIIGVQQGLRRMTSSVRFFVLKAIAISAASSMTAGLALAGDNTPTMNSIVDALKGAPATRSLSAAPKNDSEVTFINSVRNRQTRSLSMEECNQLESLTINKPKVDLEINFDYNSAAISRRSMSAVQHLGEALSDPQLKGSTSSSRVTPRRHRRRRLQPGSVGTSRRYHQELFGRQIPHPGERPRYRRLREDPVEGCGQPGQPDQSPRPGGEHRNAEQRFEVTRTRKRDTIRTNRHRALDSSRKRRHVNFGRADHGSSPPASPGSAASAALRRPARAGQGACRRNSR